MYRFFVWLMAVSLVVASAGCPKKENGGDGENDTATEEENAGNDENGGDGENGAATEEENTNEGGPAPAPPQPIDGSSETSTDS